MKYSILIVFTLAMLSCNNNKVLEIETKEDYLSRKMSYFSDSASKYFNRSMCYFDCKKIDSFKIMLRKWRVMSDSFGFYRTLAYPNWISEDKGSLVYKAKCDCN